MSTAMTAAQWRTQLKKWKVNVVYLPGWETRGRPASTAGGALAPNGIMIHHTGSDSQAQSYIDWLFKTGRPAEGIPAPLANAMSMMDGRLIMGAIGKANHAGAGVAWVLDKVINETVPLDSEIKPGARGSTNGNPRFYGDEVAFDGGQPMTPEQYATTLRWCAAICDFHNWTAQSIIGHGEWTSNKWDPGHTDMAKLRRDVDALLKAGPGGVDSSLPPAPTPEPVPTPTPTPDKMDPAAYFIGAVGSHVTWLGERLVAHGFDEHYTSGPGPKFTEADRLNVAAFQRAQGWSGADADGFPGPETLRRLAAAVPATPPTPPAEPEWDRFVKLMSYNHALARDNEYGVKSMSARIPLMEDVVESVKPDIVLGQECGGDERLDGISAMYKRQGLSRLPDGKTGRWNFANLSVVKVIATGTIEPPRDRNNDDKPAPWVVYEARGRRGAIANIHFNADKGAYFDDLRVRQGKHVAAELKTIAARYNVDPKYVIIGGDTNSEGWVTDKAMKPAGFVDSFTTAEDVKDAEFRSNNGWQPAKLGDRIDYFYVHPWLRVQAANQRLNHKASDHNAQTIIVG